MLKALKLKPAKSEPKEVDRAEIIKLINEHECGVSYCKEPTWDGSCSRYAEGVLAVTTDLRKLLGAENEL